MNKILRHILYNVFLCLLLCSCKANEPTVSTSSELESSSSATDYSNNGIEKPIADVDNDTTYDTNLKPEVYEKPFFEFDNTLSDCLPIDKSLDCEKIMLDAAEKLSVMMSNYLNVDVTKLVFELGEPLTDDGQVMAYRVISNDIKTTDDFINLFSDSIYDGYIEKICTWSPRLEEIDGELCFVGSVGGYIGSMETWYLGCDVTDDEIIGHFAELRGIENIGFDDAEYLNDENNYGFYDIIVQNVSGKYVLTDCRGLDNKMYYRIHGWLYNLGMADRNLITNAKVKPYAIA